jgi:hypothetical protein
MSDDMANWTRFLDALDQDEGDQTAYIYRIDSQGRVIRPFIQKLPANSALITHLCGIGGGQFRVIIRRGRTMVYSGRVAFQARQ